MDFEIPQFKTKLPDENSEDEMVRMSRLYTDAEGEAVIEYFSLRAELEHYSRLACARGKGYNLDTYLKEVMESETMAATLSFAVQNGFQKVDFKASWEQLSNKNGMC